MQHHFSHIYCIFQESPNSSKGNDSLDQLRNNVNTVTAVMQENTRLALQRGDRLNNLVSKTDELAASVSVCNYIMFCIIFGFNFDLCIYIQTIIIINFL